MFQTGNVISISVANWNGQLNWSVVYTYQLDAGGTQTAQVYVGATIQSAPVGVFGLAPAATVVTWSTPTSTITISPNPPGTTNPVLLACPPLVQAASVIYL